MALAVVAVQIATANEGALIEWNPERLLTWDDFDGPVPERVGDNRVAAASVSLSWSYEYMLEWSRNTCRFSINKIESAALFHPETSWVRPGHRNDAVLGHEQVHFDITEWYKRRFERETAAFVGVDRSCRGGNEQAAARYIQREISRLVGSKYDEIWQQYRREQEAYDSETRHGIDTARQAEWAAKVAAELGQ